MTEKKNVIWTRLPVVLLAACFCCFLWGSAATCIKTGYELFQIGADDTPARILFAGVRFLLAGMMVIGYSSVRAGRFLMPKRTSMKYVAALASMQTVGQYVFYYMALANLSGVRASILNCVGTFISIFLAVYLFHFEKLTVGKVLGSVLGFTGTVLIVSGGRGDLGSGASLQGEGALLAAAFAGAMAGCLIKLFSRHEDPVILSGWQFFYGGLVMIGIGLLMGGRIRVTSVACIPLILYMGFISAGAYTIWGILLSYNDVSRVTILWFMNPVFGVILSALFLGEAKEAMSLTGAAALLLVSAGIWVANRPQK